MSRLLLAVSAILGVAAAGIPDYLTPVSYDLHFQLDLDNPTNGFEGNNVIRFTTAKNIQRGITQIVLHSSGIKITSAVLLYPSKKQFTITKISYDSKAETVTLAINEELSANSLYTLTLHYNGALNGTEGLFISQYNNDNYLGMNSYPVFAKRIYPCFDKPNLRAKYSIELQIYFSKKEPVVVTGLAGSYKIVKTDVHWFKARTKYLSGQYQSVIDLPPYGFYFAVGNYIAAQKGFPLYTPNDASLKNSLNPDILDVLSTTIVTDLSKNTGINMNLVVVPGLPVATTSGYGIAALSIDSSQQKPDYPTTTLKRQAIQIFMATLKSFFASVVSPSSWENAWLAESTSSYIAHAALNQMKTSWVNWPDIEVLELQQNALSKSWSSSSLPVIPNNLSTSADVLEFLADPAIMKGAAILGMVETLATTPLISLVGFINQFKGKAASSDDFLNYYEKLNNMNKSLPDGKGLCSIVNPWLTQTGYPYLSVFRDDHRIVVNKKQFGQENNNEAWMVPLTYQTFYLNYTNSSTISASKPNFVWLDDKDNGNYTLLNDPLHNLLAVLNVRGPGTYRVLYDSSSWEKLVNNLKEDSNYISSESLRSSLVSDSFAFARSGQMGYTTLFNALRYLTSERSLGPWTMASRGLKELWSLLYYSDLRMEFENFATELMRPSFLFYGIDLNNADNMKGSITKEIIAGMCEFGDETCHKDTKNIYDTYIVGKKSIADADIIDEIYCNGIRDVTDNETMQSLLGTYSPALAQSQKKSLFYYLSCSGGDYSQSYAIQSLLDAVLVSPTYKQMPAEDMILAFKEIADKPRHYEEALDFFTNNFHDIRSTLDISQRAELFRYLGALGSTNDHISALGNFTYGNDSSTDTIPKAVQEAIKLAQSRKEFLARNYDSIYNGLYGYQPPPTKPTTKPTTDSGSTDLPPITTPSFPGNSSPVLTSMGPALFTSFLLALYHVNY